MNRIGSQVNAGGRGISSRLISLVLLLCIVILPVTALPITPLGPTIPGPTIPIPKGTLSIISHPDGAQIFLDNATASSGTTNTALNLFATSHWIKLVKPGYQTYETSVSVPAGTTTYLDVALVAMPATGTITVTSNPSDAKLYIDGAYVGLTPKTNVVAAGTHGVQVKMAGYQDSSETVAIAAGDMTVLNVDLIPIAASPATGTLTPTSTGVPPTVPLTPSPLGAKGSLYVTSTPDGAYVFLNNELRGTTPVTIQDLTPGSYTVRVSKPGYTDYTIKVPLAEGQITTLSPDLTKAEKTPGFGLVAAMSALLSVFLILRRRA